MKGFTALSLFLLTCSVAVAQQSIVKTITIKGAVNVNDIAIKAAMQTKEGSVLQNAQLRGDETRIMDLGFFSFVEILTKILSETEVEVQVNVAENPVIREIAFKGNTVVSTEALTAEVVKIQEIGKIYNNRYQARIQDAIEKIYSDKGYLVGIDQLQPDPNSPGTLLISVLEPRVNEIRFIGLKKTDEKILRRMMKVKPGDAYNEGLIRRDWEEMFSTGWFDNIEPRRLDTAQPAVYDLEFEFFETRTGQINGGIALDPQSRLVGFVSYSDSNFNGSGQAVGVNLSQATVGNGASAELAWSNRYYDSRNTAVSLRVYSKVVYNFAGNGLGGFEGPTSGSRFDERRNGGSLNFSRPFAKTHHGRFGIRYENIQSLDLDTTDPDSFVQQNGDIASVQFGIDRDTRHPTTEPFQGDYTSLMIEPSYSNITKIGGTLTTFDDILGPNYYMRAMLDFRKYWSDPVPADTPITKARPVLVFKASYGAILGDVPFFEQMFVGGLGSVRGYQSQRFWGKQSLVGTVEYRYPIPGQSSFSVIAFTDYGGAWGGYPGISTFTQSNSPNFHLGYGLGLSFKTPVGPIRIDFAFNDQGGSRTHFAFGSSF